MSANGPAERKFQKTLRARFMVRADGPPIEDAAVVVREGRVAEVGRANQVVSAAGEIIDYGDAAILPGFVNAHTHLELSGLAGRVPPGGDFCDWIRGLSRLIFAELNTFEQTQASVRAGVEQSLAAGVTTVGDITRSPVWTREALAESPLRAVSYGEVIAVGRIRDRLDDRVQAACRDIHTRQSSAGVVGDYPPRSPLVKGGGENVARYTMRECSGDLLHIGLSPHSPYMVEREGLRICAERVLPHQLPLCIHLAETRDEERFTLHGDGPLLDLLKTLHVWDERVPVAGLRPVELARQCGLLGPRTLLAHANYVNDDDIHIIADSGASVAYCPRTHHAFGHVPHRFREMLAAGVNVCVGTDSLASNPTLSVFEETRFLRERHPDLAGETLLEMGTRNGARALGLEHVCGSLTPGKVADFVVVPLPGNCKQWHEVFEGSDGPSAVYASGELVAARRPGTRDLDAED